MRVTSKTIAQKLPLADLSGLPATDPGNGKPWIDPTTHAIIVGALGTFGVSQSYVDSAISSLSNDTTNYIDDIASSLVSAIAGKQPLDSDLTAIAALTTTSFGRSLLTQADASAARTTLGAQAAITGDLSIPGNLYVGGTSVVATNQGIAVADGFGYSTSIKADGPRLNVSATIAWTNSPNSGVAADTQLARSGAGVVDVCGANVSTRGSIRAADGAFSGNLILTATSTVANANRFTLNVTDSNGFFIQTNGTNRWQFTGAGALWSSPDNTNDIGQSGNLRPRDLFLGRNLTVGGTATLNGTTSINGSTLNVWSFAGSGSFTALSLQGPTASGSSVNVDYRFSSVGTLASERVTQTSSGNGKWAIWTATANTLSEKFSIDNAGFASFSGAVKLGAFTVATLPSASANASAEANVTDSSVTTFGSTVAGGGSSNVKVRSNGTNWTVCGI